MAVTAWGPFSLAAQLFGVERFMQGMFKARELVKEVLEFATEVLFQFYAPMIRAGYLKTLALADPTASGDLISRRQFGEFGVPYLKKLSERVREMGALVFLHICGNTTDRLELLPETGAHLIALDYKVDIGEAKRRIGDRMCIAGNVNPVSVLDQGTPELVRRESLACVEKAAAGGGFVLLPTVPLENIRAMIDVARGYRY